MEMIITASAISGLLSVIFIILSIILVIKKTKPACAILFSVLGTALSIYPVALFFSTLALKKVLPIMLIWDIVVICIAIKSKDKDGE